MEKRNLRKLQDAASQAAGNGFFYENRNLGEVERGSRNLSYHGD